MRVLPLPTATANWEVTPQRDDVGQQLQPRQHILAQQPGQPTYVHSEQCVVLDQPASVNTGQSVVTVPGQPAYAHLAQSVVLGQPAYGHSVFTVPGQPAYAQSGQSVVPGQPAYTQPGQTNPVQPAMYTVGIESIVFIHVCVY